MKDSRRGFTLIELIIVIVIIGILAVIAIPKYFANINKARKAEAFASMGAIREAESAYAAANLGVYTTSFPISVDIDGDGTADVALGLPNSANYGYSVVRTDSTAYVKATSTGTWPTEYMCIMSGETSASAPACST